MPRRVRILFVCRENACRSQMAEAIARAVGGDQVSAASAGSTPRGSVDARAIDVMAACGMPMTGHTSKGLDQVGPGPWDAVVGMGCGDACVHVPSKHHAEWQIPDPAGKDLETYQAVQASIEAHVKALLTHLGVTPRAGRSR